MRLAWFIGGLSLLVSTTGCCGGSCGWGNCGRGTPATYQAATPQQYGTAGTYASTPPGAALGSTAMADGTMAPAGTPNSGASGAMPTAGSSLEGSGVEPASYGVPAGE